MIMQRRIISTTQNIFNLKYAHLRTAKREEEFNVPICLALCMHHVCAGDSTG